MRSTCAAGHGGTGVPAPRRLFDYFGYEIQAAFDLRRDRLVERVLVAFGDLDTFFVSEGTVVASPALAALKEAVFQVTMAEFDPPRDISRLRDMAARLTGATKKLVLPTLGSFTRRKRAGRRTSVR